MSNYPFFQDIIDDPYPFALVRNVSEDNFFSVFLSTKSEITQIQPIRLQPITKHEFMTHEQQTIVPNFIEYRKKQIKKGIHPQNERRDYKKNICGYITKKIVRQFMSQTYKQKVETLCNKYECQYEEVVDFYDKKIERITGPTHLDMLLNGSRQEGEKKKCFKQFFIWFLRHRYLRYLLSEGKMDKKEAYVDYKNKTLLYLGSLEEKIECNSSSYGEFQSRETVSMN